MKLKFLGTAAAEGWPALFCQCDACRRARRLGGKNIRTRSSCLIDEEYMVDFSADTYMHVLNEGLDLTKVKHLIITHSHEDHFYPSDLMMRRQPFAYMDKPEPLTIYGNDKVQSCFDAVNGARNDNILIFRQVRAYEPFSAGEAVITPLLADHSPEEQCFVYVIELNGKKLLYGHDSGYFPETTWEVLRNYMLDGVVLDCTSGPQSCEHYHMGLPQDIKVKERLLEQASAGDNTIFIINHFSHNGGLLYDQLVETAAPHNFKVTYDGMEIEI
ncbi:MAG: phosphoribosyl 1,2-cyclic phosphate phosphodiesterase [Clostridiales bacterium]|jgi:phosphoribosyl 1,2-cyclic phosphate phosphodiesterase|nr:phosphoribosyl 1,2-cyclic phosphate phosphodiesterase [Clostridiales bacterium]